MKKAFTLEPVLAVPDLNREMQVEADVSDYATGGVLSVKCEDGKWRPVAFIVMMSWLDKMAKVIIYFSFLFFSFLDLLYKDGV